MSQGERKFAVPKRSPVSVVLMMVLSLLLVGPVLAQTDDWSANMGDVVYGTALAADGSVQVIGSRNDRAAAYDAQGNLLWEFAPNGTVWGVDVSADGQWTAVASEDRHVYLLDANGQEVWRYRSSRIVLDVAISRDGSHVFASDEGRDVYYLSRETGEAVWQYNLPNIADTITMYGDSTIRPIAGTRDSQVWLFSPEGKRLWQAQLADDIVSVSVMDNGAQVLVGSLDGTVTLLHGGNTSVIWRVQLPVTCNTRQRTFCLNIAISGEGDALLVGTRSGDVFLLDPEDGRILQQHNYGDAVSSVALSRDGSTWLIGMRGGQVQATTAEAAAAAHSAAQTAQRNLMIAIPSAILILLAGTTIWINRTPSGQYFWTETTKPARKMLARMWRSRVSYLLILPTLLLLLIFNYYPAASGLYHSFTDWNPGAETTWVGLKQFEAMIDSQYFWVGMKNAVVLAVSAFAKLAIPLLVAELIFHIRLGALQYTIRTMFIVPLVVPSVVGILLWVNIYDPNIGLLNQSLNALGLESLTRAWLGDKNTAMSAIVAIGFPWISPFALLIFYGGLIGIPQELFDAAKVDGANWWRRFTRIDLPMIMPQVKLLLILAFIGSIQEFQLIFLTTGGGPGSVTYTPALELYYNATLFTNFGLASAMGTFLFLIILGGTIINLRYVRSQVEYEA
jgi:ABC-type sugar transport system permease subunit/outer membrane protein assembly factor BamB